MDTSTSALATPAVPTFSDELQPLLPQKVLLKRFLTTRKWFGSPAIITILAITFLAQILYHFFSNPSHLLPYYLDKFGNYTHIGMHHPSLVKNVLMQACPTALFMVYPLAGYLADTKFGHFRTILMSLRIVVISLAICLIGAGILVPAFISMPERSIARIILIVIGTISFFTGLIPLLLALVGIGANIVLLGLDQLFDAPWDDQVVFIYWYMWVAFSARLAIETFTILYCLSSNQLVYYMIAGIIFSVMLLVLIILLFLVTWKKRWFIRNYYKSRENSYQLVYRATKYARQKNGLLKCLCCKNQVPAGLDIGMLRFGGPFTAEQIEDVKAFYGIVKVLFVSGIFFYFAHVTYSMNQMLSSHINSEIESNSSMLTNISFPHACHRTTRKAILSILFPRMIIVILLPLKIFLLRPLILPHLPGMLKNIGIVMALTMLPMMSSFLLDTATHLENRNLQCMLDLPSGELMDGRLPIAHRISKYFDIYNAVTVSFTDYLAVVMYVNLYKFICSQSPHSTKGFLVGLAFAVFGFYDLAHPLLAMGFGYAWRVFHSFPSCGMIYYVINIVFVVVGVLVYFGIARNYKYRRSGSVPNSMEDRCTKVQNRLNNYGIL